MKKLIPLLISFLILSEITIAQDKWQNTVSSTFGTSGNQRITSMNVFNGKIYAGAGSNTGEVYSSPTGDANSWTKVFSQGFVTSIDAMNSTTQGGGYIYISGYAYGSDNPRIYRSADGSPGSWSSYYDSYDRMPFIFPFKGAGTVDSMYIVREGNQFGMILKAAYDNNDPSNSSNTFDTVLNLNTESPYTYIRSYAQHNNLLYVGTSNGKIWKSSANGNTWKQDTLFQPGFGNSNNNSFSAMASFGGYLYVGTENYSDGAQIWRSNDDATWTKLPQAFGGGKISSLNVISGQLWATFESCCSSSGRILKSTNGTTFISSDTTGFGIKANHGVAGSTVLFGSQVYYGFENMDNGMPQLSNKDQPQKSALTGPMGSSIYGGQIWRTCIGALPVVNLGADQLVCGGVAVTFNAGAGAIAYLWSDGSTTQTISPNKSGDYFVTVTGSNGCQNTDTVTITNKATPHVMITNPEGPVTLCKNDTLSITTVPTSNLRITLPAVNRKTNDSILDYKVTTDTLVVSGVNDDGVNNTLVSVTIDSLYHPDNGEIVLMLFDPSGGVITLSSNNGYGTSNYIGTTFSMNASTSITSANGPFTGSFIPQDAFSNFNGFYTNGKWVLQVSDYTTGNQGVIKGWSLKFSDPDTIMTYSWTPATGLTANNTHNTKAIGTTSTKYALKTTNNIGCSSIDSVKITVPAIHISPATASICIGSTATLSATGGSTYYWSPAAGLSNTTGANVTATPTVTTKYYARDTVPGLGCVIVDSAIVTVNPLPVVVINSPAVCSGQSITLTASGASTYSWSTSATTSSITVTPAATTSYSITGTSAAGCSATASSTVTVNPLPTANAGADQTMCLGIATNFTDASTITSGSITSWNWNFGDSGSSTQKNPTHTYTTAGSYTVTLTVISSAGCTASDNVIITIADLPAVNISSTNVTCYGLLNGTATASATGGFSPFNYVWSTGITTAPITGISSGTYTVTVKNSAGCSATKSVVITQPAAAVAANAGTSQTICFADSAVFTGSATGGTPPYTYSWNTGSTKQTIKISPAATSSYTLTAMDNAGCTANASSTVTVNPLPTANAGADQTMCLGSATNFTDASTITSGSITSWNWNFGDSGNSVQQNPTHTYATTGSYTVTLTVTSSAGCTASDNVIITIADFAVVNTSSTNVTCYGLFNGTATASATGGFSPFNYLWSTGLTTATASGLGFGTYTVTVKNSAGCSTTSSVTITQPTAVIVDAGLSQTICFADTALFTGSVTGGTPPYSAFSWNTGSTKQTIKVSPLTKTTYTLTVNDNNGCMAKDTTTLTLTPSTDVYGHVDTSGTSITKGNVVIYKYLPYKTHFDTIQVQALDASGNYHFTGINHGDYLIEVFADTLKYPNGIPTYYGNKSLWNVSSSEIVNHNCNATDTFNIKLISIHPVPVGPGSLSGYVFKGPGFGTSHMLQAPYTPERTDPIPGVDVKLGKNPGGSANIVGHTKTDSTGYHFGNLSLDTTYIVFVDIPGLGRDSSYVITPTILDPVFINLNYIADSTTIHYIPTSSVGIKNSGVITNDKWSVYPNPSYGDATIEYFINMDANVSLGIYNVLGIKVVDIVNNEQHTGTYKYNISTKKNNLSPGVYFITLTVDGKVNVKRLVITE